MNEEKHILLRVRGLKTWFGAGERPFRAVDGVDFDLNACETLALVGESGCGKSVTALSLMQLVPAPAGRIVEGSVKLRGKELLGRSEVEMRKVRGARIAMIFQEPLTSLNPVFTIGSQLAELMQIHGGMDRNAALEQAERLLRRVEIPDPKQRLHAYPHELSGGQAQRVMIAMALSCDPLLLIADEPTTALDVTVQAQILALMSDLQDRTNAAIMLITHNLGVVAETCDRIAVMYAGNVVEQASAIALFVNPMHPYTQGLLGSIPLLHEEKEELAIIPGIVPNLIYPPPGCRFHNRCSQAMEICNQRKPPLITVEPRHQVACFLYGEGEGE